MKILLPEKSYTFGELSEIKVEVDEFDYTVNLED